MSRLSLILLSALLALCTACAKAPAPSSDPDGDTVSVIAPVSSQNAPEPQPEPEPVSEPVPEPAPEPEPVLEPESVPKQEPTPPSDPEPVPEPVPEQEPFSDHAPMLQLPVSSAYDFTAPVPESPAVDNSYFADAVFVGDSRTDGFWRFSGVKQGKRLTCDGLSVFTLDKTPAIHVNGTAYTVLDALALKDYAKVYLCLGVNELGYRDDEAFYRAYCDAIDAVRACQPDAVIYVQTLIPLNEGKVAASGGFGYLKNDHLRAYNELICKAAAEKQVPVLDLYTHFAVDGQLPADASRDGVHLLAPYCKKQLEYFKTHTVDFQTLYAPPAEPAPEPAPDTPDPAPSPDTFHTAPEVTQP